jgi:putative membrane protein
MPPQETAAQSPTARRSRLATRLLPGGTEPDPRFTLANERTFLAWIRTALAFLAGGIALEAFTAGLLPEGARTTLAVLLLVAGSTIALGAATRWLSVERSLRHGSPLNLPLLAPLLGMACGAASTVLVVAVIAH